jgi:hypothetical protein
MVRFQGGAWFAPFFRLGLGGNRFQNKVISLGGFLFGFDNPIAGDGLLDVFIFGKKELGAAAVAVAVCLINDGPAIGTALDGHWFIYRMEP